MNILSLRGATRSIRRLLYLFVFTGLVVLADMPATAQTTSTWTGGAGNWSPCPQDSGSALWDTCSGDVYPNGNYNAVIQGGPVTVNTGFGIVGLSVATGDTLYITPGYLDITGTSVVNNGTISIGPGDGLQLATQGATVTLSGTGTVNLTSQNSYFIGTQGTAPRLVNQETITGQGSLAGELLSIVNQGTINAVGGLLTVEVNPTGSITNTSLMEASNGANLWLITPVTNTGGTIEALNGGTVTLDGAVTGGTLTTAGTGVIQLTADSTLNGLTNAGLAEVSSNTALLQNTVTNNGTLQVTNGTLFMAGPVTLQGTGSLLLTNAFSDLEQNTTSVGPPGGSLISQQLIHGGGTLYDLPLTNQATIEADNPSVPLYVNTATTNTGTLEASGGAQLVISSSTTVDNAGGTIDALTGSSVLIEGTVSGGTVKNTGTGLLESENATLDGTVNIPTIAGIFKIAAGNDTTLEGTVNNTGTIEFLGNGCLVAGTPTTTLAGDGKVILGTNDCIYGSGNTFINNSTIEGSGEVGDSNPMPIINNGTFLANKSAPLRIAPNPGGFTNNGKLTVSKGGVMVINTIGGPFNNLAGGTLTGGSYLVTGMLELSGAITTNDASITLTGSAAGILNTSSNGSALFGLSANATKGVLSLQSGQVLITGAGFSNAGKITVGAGSSLSVGGSYTQTAGTTTVDGTLAAPTGLVLQKGTVEGKGTLAGAVTSDGTLTVGDAVTKAGLLTINGTYSQGSTGILDTAIGGTTAGTQYSQLAVSNGVSLGGTLGLKLIGGFVPAVGDTFTIVTGSAVSGQFTTVKGTTINSGEHFEMNYGPTSVTVEVVSGT